MKGGQQGERDGKVVHTRGIRKAPETKTLARNVIEKPGGQIRDAGQREPRGVDKEETSIDRGL